MNYYYDGLQREVLALRGIPWGKTNLNDEAKELIKMSAHANLVDLTTVDFGMDADAWQNWLDTNQHDIDRFVRDEVKQEVIPNYSL